MKRDLILLFSSDLSFILSGFLVQIFLANVLSQVDFAIASLLITTMTAIRLIFASGYPKVVSVAIALEDKGNGNPANFASASLLTQLLITMVIVPPLVWYSRDLLQLFVPITNIYTAIIIGNIILISGFAHLDIAIANGFKNFTKQSLSKLVIGLSKLVFILFIVYQERSVESLLWSYFVAYFMADIIVIAILRSYFSRLLRFTQLLKELRRYLSAIPLSISAIFSYLLVSLYIYWISYIYDDLLVVGYYSASSIISTGLIFLTRSLGSYIRPSATETSELALDPKSTDNINLMITAIFGLQFLMIGIIATFNELILDILFPPGYLKAAAIFILLSFSSSFFALIEILQNLIIAKKKDLQASLIYYLAVFIFIVLNILVFQFISQAITVVALNLAISLGLSLLLAVYLTARFADKHIKAITKTVPFLFLAIVIGTIRIMEITYSFEISLVLLTILTLAFVSMNRQLLHSAWETVTKLIGFN